MFHFSDLIPIYTILYSLQFSHSVKTTLKMSVKVKIRIRRKYTVISHQNAPAVESDSQKIELMVRIW